MKRKNGEGSYGKRTINNNIYYYYKFPNGHFVYGKTQNELEEKIKVQRLYNIAGSELSGITVTELCNIWLREKKNNISYSVYDKYDCLISNMISDSKLGQMKLSKIKEQNVQDYINGLTQKYSLGTIRKVWSLLKQTFEFSILKYSTPKLVLNTIKLPGKNSVKIKEKKVPFTTEEDMENLYNEYKNNYYSIKGDIIIFLMYTGCRVSEVLPATWDQITDNYESIYIDKAASEIVKRDRYGNPIKDKSGNIIHETIIKGPKTENGERIIPLPERAVELLKKLYDQESHGKGDLIFPDSNNKMCTRANVYSVFEKMQVKANCTQKYTVHSLRHGYASYLIAHGIDIKIVSELMGHKNVQETYNRYVGVSFDNKIKAVSNAFDN